MHAKEWFALVLSGYLLLQTTNFVSFTVQRKLKEHSAIGESAKGRTRKILQDILKWSQHNESLLINANNQGRSAFTSCRKSPKCDMKCVKEKLEPNVGNISCSALFMQDAKEIERVENNSKILTHEPISPLTYRRLIESGCSYFKETRDYPKYDLTLDEIDFPLAYSIVMYRDVDLTERLLRAIYRPHNVYCIHVDMKALADVYLAATAIAGCFDNVFVTSARVSVKWGEMSVLQAELNCMQELWEKGKSWKYFINLTGHEFPLKTNLEIIQILKSTNGTNLVTKHRVIPRRYTATGKPPHNITAFKGGVHVAVTRDFVDYILHDKRAADLLDWVNKTRIPDETFFPTLNFNADLEVPGSVNVSMLNQTAMGRIRFKLSGERCLGRRVRGICILGVRYLPHLAASPAIFANKFHSDFEPVALDCLEKLMLNRTKKEYL